MRRRPPITTSERQSGARPAGQKLAVVMVGLPARGKTFVARKLQGYLSWLGYRTLWVNVGDYRRSRAGARQPAAYFAPDNTATREEREGFATAALNDLLDWFNKGGEVGIYDATNAERPRRDLIRQQCSAAGVDVPLLPGAAQQEYDKGAVTGHDPQRGEGLRQALEERQISSDQENLRHGLLCPHHDVVAMLETTPRTARSESLPW